MNAELLVNVIKDHLVDGKDLEIVKNLYSDDKYTRLKWKSAKDIFSGGQQVTGLDFPDGRIGLTSAYSTVGEIKKILESNDLHFKTYKGYYSYHFTVNPGRLKIDFLSLYQNDTDKFLNYFKLLDREEKKDVLEGILDCEYANEEVVGWLNKHEIDLLREITLNE